jgi:hypothetical protein
MWSIYDGAHVEWRQGKTGAIVWVPAHRELRALLETAARTATTIVTGTAGRPPTDSGLAEGLRTLILRLELEVRISDGLTFLGLRHAAGKTLAGLGADPRVIQACSVNVAFPRRSDRAKRLLGAKPGRQAAS